MTFDVYLWIVKALHVSAIALWAGGLLAMPTLFRQRSDVVGEEENRLHRVARFLFVKLVSPAAFVAVATGTLLIFMRETFVEWFSLKLAAVGVLALLHLTQGLLLLRLFSSEKPLSFGYLRSGALTATGVVAVTTILWLVLAKPDWRVRGDAGIFEPGALRDLVSPLIAWMI